MIDEQPRSKGDSVAAILLSLALMCVIYVIKYGSIF